MSSSNVQRGLIGNRLPSMDQKSAGVIGGNGLRKVSDTGSKGLIGNRIPSFVASKGRSASPGSPAESSARSLSQTTGSISPATSRSTSPPTSPATALPAHLLAATLPDDGGPGAATPSSTYADAGEEVEERSMPSTPVAGATPLAPGDFDLVPGALNLASEAEAESATEPTPSITSSQVSQYDPSSTGEGEEVERMKTVSGISTPSQTPKGIRRELDSASVVGEGSVRGEDDEVMKDGEVEELTARLGGLQAATDGEYASVSVNDQNPLEATKSEEEPQTPKAEEEAIPSLATIETAEPKVTADPTDTPDAVDTDPNLASDLAAIKSGTLDSTPAPAPHQTLPTIPDTSAPIPDPNQASDLDDLKHGLLSSGPERDDALPENPASILAEKAMLSGLHETVVPPEERLQQGGEAGKIMEDVEWQTGVELPDQKEEQIRADEDVEIVDIDADAEEDEEKKVGGEDEGEKNEAEDRKEEVEGRKEQVRAISPGHTSRKETIEPKVIVTDEGVLVTRAGKDKLNEGEEEDAKVDTSAKTLTLDDEGLKKHGDVLSKSIPFPAREPETKPLQVNIEPAPIAQPAEDDATPLADRESELVADESSASVNEESEKRDPVTPSTESEPAFITAHGSPTPLEPETEPPSFPTPPSGLLPSDAEIDPSSALSTPVDPTLLHSFPTVPDEEKPRVEVHVSVPSPTNTPRKASTATEHSTPVALAKLDFTQDDNDETPRKSGGSLDIDRAEQSTPQGEGLSKRSSTASRKSPKSPLLDDEDPGDFEPGEGWAVVTK